MPHPLDRILNPRRLAVIGASSDPEKRGYRAIRTLLADHYKGEIVPINPKASEILGLKCYPSIEAVPGEVDLALVCTPAKAAPEVIEACGRKGVKGALLLAGGFSEASEAGRLLEERTVEIARRHGVRLIGPNTNGIFTAREACNAIAWFDIPRGPAAMLANSANVMLSILAEAQFHQYFGFNTLLSVGNQSDIQFHEYLSAMGDDPDTGAVISYIEGFKDGRAFIEAARSVTPKKPIVMFKAGRTADGVRAARSHSGSLAGDYTVATGVLKQAGITLLDRSDCLYPVAEALHLLPPMRSRRVAVLSEGGGVITVAAEALSERGLVLAPLSEATQARIHEIVPNASAISNPVDAGGGTDPRAEYYGLCGAAILADPNVDALMLTGFFGGYARRYGDGVAEMEFKVARDLADLMRSHGKPVVVQSHYAHYRTPALDVLRKAGVPFYRHIEIAAQCLASAADYSEAKRRMAAASAAPSSTSPMAAAPGLPDAAAKVIAGARAAGRSALLETEARALLAACGVPLAPACLLRGADDAAAAIAALGDGPLALKVVSPDVLHKSDAGGVRLGVQGEAAVRAAVEGIMAAVGQAVPGARIEGVLAAPMAARGVELIVGVSQDPQFGPVLLFGVGGIFVEAVRDVVFRALPVSRADALEMIGDIRAQKMLDGVRGLPALDRAVLADLLVQVARVEQAAGAAGTGIAEIDLNPVIATGDGLVIADARMILA
ncbi:MAG: acetate--CoA ligase family protein [Betaproteobacteria bacterium]|jgi:acetyltransferase|nr:acetate--CoA ligase family protein [Betaproteobacteria bacterium]